MNVLKEIAYGKGIALQLEEAPSFSTEVCNLKHEPKITIIKAT